ncbi:phosphoserine phosphatase SerB [Notoacmeibacter ruber]|uniref:Phosphoserine phosphatase n=1 Tax=Notoacmeibacter ruber TaxID=2670375 RepID=A0A3L7JBY0_9HYPH|nr:phosphoserine phosphatase SerB [Notoacmeibacter ruber]RLQ88146.1 phosphoserine phosphatase SerB [Notoacmeibacter ruber]
MPLVATLIAAPASNILSSERAASLASELSAEPICLSEGEAYDFVITGETGGDAAEGTIRSLLGDLPVDVVVQDQEERRKSVLIADMDSTMIQQECIDELADMVDMKEHVAAITARAMNGEIAFEPALRERVALLRDLDVGVIEQVIEQRITLMPGGRELIATMRAHGGYCALVSGGFTAFTSRIASMLGFDEHRANELLEKDGKLSGEVAEPILGRDAKVRALREVTSARGLTPDDAIAVGDGANDLGMIQLAGTGIALHAKPSVAAEARFRIDHGNLTAILFLQGYRRDEFVY